MDDIILHKVDSLERCLRRINETFLGHESQLADDLDMQDIIILNLQRACQTAIDMGMHVIRQKRLGVPKESREVFSLLVIANLIPKELAESLQKMVGFRNIAIHEYHSIDYAVVKSIINNKLLDLKEFSRLMLLLAKQ